MSQVSEVPPPESSPYELRVRRPTRGYGEYVPHPEDYDMDEDVKPNRRYAFFKSIFH